MKPPPKKGGDPRRPCFPGAYIFGGTDHCEQGARKQGTGLEAWDPWAQSPVWSSQNLFFF